MTSIFYTFTFTSWHCPPVMSYGPIIGMSYRYGRTPNPYVSYSMLSLVRAIPPAPLPEEEGSRWCLYRYSP